MFSLSSAQDQVSNFIVNNAYSGQTSSLRSSRNVMTKKNKYKFYNPITEGIFDLIKKKCFSAFKNYPLSINNL